MSGKLRATSAALLFAAIALAVGLSASPHLHEWLHKIGDRTDHACAATLISSGSIEHSAITPLLLQPVLSSHGAAIQTQRARPVFASLEFSRLEHAPPAHS
jgi:hypothetical protein